jgi:hypothetical protein
MSEEVVSTMPTRFERDDAGRRVVVTVSGAFNANDMIAVIRRQRVEQAWSYGLLYDLRQMTSYPTLEDLRHVFAEGIQKHTPAEPRGPIAILTADPIAPGVARTYQALGQSKLIIEVFRDWDEADRWLTANMSPIR